MTTRKNNPHRLRTPAALAGVAAAALLVSCGGGNPLSNPDSLQNPPPNTSGQKLSFRYFQTCINPIFLAQLQINQGGVISTNTCASGGCHDNTTGTGGALRLVQAATAVDLTNAANTPDVVRLTDMFKNFYSAQGATIIGGALQSRLLDKPLLKGVLHGGGLIFADETDPNAKQIAYWINHPMPAGQDEFSTAGDALFAPPGSQTCSTQ